MRDRLKFLPFLLAVSVGLAVLAAIVGLIIAGGAAAAGAAVGVIFIALVYTLSTIFIAWVETINRALMLAAAMTAFLAKLILLVLVIEVLGRLSWAGLHPMLYGVAAGALVWILAQSWWLWNARIPYVELPEK